MAIKSPVTKPPTRPAVDEWGVYDPQQAGLAALFARIDSRAETSAKADDSKAPDAAPALPIVPPARPTLRDAK